MPTPSDSFGVVEEEIMSPQFVTISVNLDQLFPLPSLPLSCITLHIFSLCSHRLLSWFCSSCVLVLYLLFFFVSLVSSLGHRLSFKIALNSPHFSCYITVKVMQVLHRPPFLNGTGRAVHTQSAVRMWACTTQGSKTLIDLGSGTEQVH